ncbi:MAG: preprotein translocase subunit YajC [Lachnospiraceae bacterium]|nr:preprotein translocase subunit YajC [Lachnospiraceae bacterium]MCR5409736.1 preprotein translocase subunit YajC [Lachnospiraceae bacterium]
MGILAAGFLSTGNGQTVATVLYIVAILAFLYFIMIRPQNKERNRVKDMIASLEVGDSVCTTGGFYGIIIDVTDDTVIVEFGNNKNCRIPMKKEAIVEIEKPQESSDQDKKK